MVCMSLAGCELGKGLVRVACVPHSFQFSVHMRRPASLQFAQWLAGRPSGSSRSTLCAHVRVQRDLPGCLVKGLDSGNAILSRGSLGYPHVVCVHYNVYVVYVYLPCPVRLVAAGGVNDTFCMHACTSYCSRISVH